MLLSLNWLRDHLSIPKNISPEELSQKLTLHTVEVEKIKSQAESFENVIVAKVLEVKKHPNADRLQIAKVDAGKEKGILIIVCGAPNIAAGQIVPLALPGAILPNGAEIKEAEVRGEKSQGMICAEDELGLGNNHDGIMILEKGKIGQNFASYLKLDDIIIEVDNKSLSNRPDLWGHYGIAREISAILNIKLKEIENKKIEKNRIKEEEEIKIEVKDYKICQRYNAVKIKNVEIKESPEWIQKRLVAVGLKPINNIVDITNYVMLELGQPLHAFNAEKIEEIIIRRGKKNETIKTLDEKERKLDENILVISNDKEAIAIAGIMGGLNSAITKETKDIIIESANFEATIIRQGSTKLNLRTDASMRFEKALDHYLTKKALNLALTMILKDCKKAYISCPINDLHKELPENPEIEMDLGWLNKIMGLKIETPKIKEILLNLGFEITPKGKNKEGYEILIIKIPSWRATKDVVAKEDVAEEIMRLYGYNNFPGKNPLVYMEAPEKNEERELEDKIKEILSKETKLSEVYNYSFTNEEELKKLNLDFGKYIKLVNPISKQHTLLRQNLIPGLINNIRTNQHKYKEIELFEIGMTFLNVLGDLEKNEKENERLPHQEKQLGLVIAGDEPEVFNKTKGIISNLIFSLTSGQIETNFLPADFNIPYSDKNLKASINIKNKNIGSVALLDDNIAKNNGLKKKVVLVELNFKELLKIHLNYALKQYQPIPKYPPIVRDLAFVIDEKILYNDLKVAIFNFNDLISSVELFDVYSGDNLGTDKKSLAFHIIYQSSEKTLTSEEIDNIQKDLIKYLQSKFEAHIRDF